MNKKSFNRDTNITKTFIVLSAPPTAEKPKLTISHYDSNDNQWYHSHSVLSNWKFLPQMFSNSLRNFSCSNFKSLKQST